MHITNGFVYFFGLTMIALTCGLVIFTIRPIRRIVFNFFKKNRLLDNSIIQYVLYISFAIIGLILIDSIWTYYSLKHRLSPEQYSLLGKDYSMISQVHEGHQNIIAVFKQQRQLYMAERNFMLTISSLVGYFMFTRFLVAINKLNDIENQIEKTPTARIQKVK